MNSIFVGWSALFCPPLLSPEVMWWAEKRCPPYDLNVCQCDAYEH